MRRKDTFFAIGNSTGSDDGAADAALDGQIQSLRALAEADGDAAAAEATRLLQSDGAVRPVVAECARILALAAVRAGDIEAANDHLRRAITAAETHADGTLLGAVLLTGMSVAATAGDFDAALALGDRARPLLPPDQAIRADIQRATVLMVSNRGREAIAAFRSILSAEQDLDPLAGGYVRLNLGLLHVRQDDLVEATPLLQDARELFVSIGNVEHATGCSLHLALAAARNGDHATVFSVHEDLRESGAFDQASPRTLADMAECLLVAGLLDETRQLLDAARAALVDKPPTEFSAHVAVMYAQLMQRVDARHATEAADHAVAHAQSLGDDVRVARAAVQRMAVGDPTDIDTIDRLLAAAALFRSNALDGSALDAEILAMERMLRSAPGDQAPGARLYGVEPSPPLAGSATQRAQIHHHRALRSACAGDGGLARRELASGLRALERSRAQLSADDLRASATDRAPAMAEFGVRLAASNGRADQLFEWAERLRATSLRFSQVGPADPAAARLELDSLRRATTSSSADVADIERAIVARRRSVGVDAAVERAVSARDVKRVLRADQVLLEYVIVDDHVSAIVISKRRTRVIRLDVELPHLRETLDKLLFGIRRASTTVGAAADAAVSMVETLGARLEQALIPADARAGSVVIVPSGVLHHVPWAAMPGLATRSFVVAPSAHSWIAASRRPERSGPVLAASGNDLVEAAAELADVVSHWPNGRSLDRATSADLIEHAAGARLLHLACHGRFRTDSPQFSSLSLEDGPFTVLDLEAVTDMPSLVVLSACDVGSVDVKDGDDILGFPAALMGRGVRSLVAATSPVEDSAARALMSAFHGALVGGVDAADALRVARNDVRTRSPAHLAAAGSFVCFGAA